LNKLIYKDIILMMTFLIYEILIKLLLLLLKQKQGRTLWGRWKRKREMIVKWWWTSFINGIFDTHMKT